MLLYGLVRAFVWTKDLPAAPALAGGPLKQGEDGKAEAAAVLTEEAPKARKRTPKA